MANIYGEPVAFPDDEIIPLPAIPDDRVAVVMFTAHRIDDATSHVLHAQERMGAADRAAPEMRGYHLRHINNHLTDALEGFHALSDNLMLHYPAEGAELEALSATIGGGARTSATQKKANTFAHLTQTVLYQLGHAKRHALTARNARSQAEWEFDRDHLGNHLDGAYEHLCKLAAHVRDNYPAEWSFLSQLEPNYASM